jgi:DNA-binding transcriptional ArsR family regulator
MEHETLFTASKWEILKQLELRERSPIELAKICSTSVANVSQQLRLLEMAGLVTSRRVSNRDKDKPRILYSLAGNLSYVIATSDKFVDKKVLQLSEYNKIIMRIWFLDDPSVRYALEKIFWKIEESMPKISFLAFDKERTSPLTVYYVAGGKNLELKPFTITDNTGVTRQVLFSMKLPDSAQQLHILYDPKGIAENGALENTQHKRKRGDGNEQR